MYILMSPLQYNTDTFIDGLPFTLSTEQESDWIFFSLYSMRRCLWGRLLNCLFLKRAKALSNSLQYTHLTGFEKKKLHVNLLGFIQTFELFSTAPWFLNTASHSFIFVISTLAFEHFTSLDDLSLDDLKGLKGCHRLALYICIMSQKHGELLKTWIFVCFL